MLIDRCFDERFEGEEARVSGRLYMDHSQIACLGREGAIGVHGHQHLPLGLMPAAAVSEQIDLCIRHLETMAVRSPFALSYPFGEREACSAEAAAVAAGHGIEFAFTMERAGNPDLNHPLHLARFDCNDVPGGKRPYWPDEHFFSSVPAASWHRPTPSLSEARSQLSAM